MEKRGAWTRPAAVLLGSLAVAAASLLIIRALSYDAWGWMMWGRELVTRLPFQTDSYPTWKPLTGLVAAAFAPLGSAAPILWLLLARFGSVLSLVLAYRLASRLAGRLAGALAALSLLLAPDWVFQTGVGGSEPLLTALLLGAVDRHVDEKDGTGFALVLAAALLRPESWPLLLVSAGVAWVRRPRARPLILLGLLAVPCLWFGGDYLGSGYAFEGGRLAKLSREAQLLRRSATPPPLDVLLRGFGALPLALLPGIAVALARGWPKRDPIVLTLVAGGLVWLAEVAVLAGLGYAGVTRFLFPAIAALAVVGAAGIVWLLRDPRPSPLLRGALAVTLVLLAVPSVQRIAQVPHQAAHVEGRADLEQGLDRLVTRVGARELRASPALSSEGVALTPLAWRLDVPPQSLRGTRIPGLRVALRDRRWRPFWQEVHRRGFHGRTVFRDGRLFLISIEGD